MSSNGQPPGGKAPGGKAPDETLIIPHERTIAGKYRLHRLIGEGGMGSVYEAEHVGLGVRVAIKLLAESFSEDQVFVQRFRREARAAAAVRHDNVVSVTDTGTDEDGIPFLVMELLDGESLASVLRRARTLTPESAAGIVFQVLAGLGAAHAKGVVHRDLKPANVFLVLSPDSRQLVKILDFGISKFTSDLANSVTQEGAVVGTPSYMAPEQVRGAADVDGRADLYAVGIMLYRMLCGKLPFAAKQTRDIYQKILDGHFIPPRDHRPEISRALEEVILHAIRTEANLRFQTAAEFQHALVEAIPSLEQTNPVPVYGRDATPNSGSLPEITRTSPSQYERQAQLGNSLRTRPDRPRTRPRSTRWSMFLLGALSVTCLAIGAVWLTQQGFFDSGKTANHPVDTGAAPGGFDPNTPGQIPVTATPLWYGVSKHAGQSTVEKEHSPLADYLSRRLRRPVKLRVVPQQDLPTQLEHGTIQLAALSAIPYVQAKNRVPRLRMIAMAYLPAGPTYKGLVVVRSDSGVSQLAQLAGRRFCYTNASSSSGYHYPRALFRRAGFDPDGFFSAVVFAQDHETAVRLLAEGQCDGAAIYESMLYDQASHGFDYRMFRAIEDTGKIPYDAYCVNADQLSEAEAAELEEALLALEPGGQLARQALGGSDVQGFIQGNDAAYDDAREVLRFLDDSGSTTR